MFENVLTSGCTSLNKFQIVELNKSVFALQDSNASHLDLGLCLKGHNSDHDSVGESKEDQVKNASSGGFWTIG